MLCTVVVRLQLDFVHCVQSAVYTGAQRAGVESSWLLVELHILYNQRK